MRVWLVAGFVVGLALGTCAAQDDAVRRLEQIADGSDGSDCARYSLAVALHTIETANHNYNDGNVDEAETAVNLTMHYAERGAKCALFSRKQQRETEISLRRLSKRFADIERSLSYDDRPLVHAQIDKIDNWRSQLMVAMFGGKASEALKPRE